MKKNNSFSFIEVYDDATFLENFIVVKEIVKLLQKFKFKYDSKQQFLGDFFEDLLNTSLKQEAGQFFTPYPLVDFMVNSLDIEERVDNALQSRNLDFVPKVIDYACGAGHFLISAMTAIQKVFNRIDPARLTHEQQKKHKGFIESPYSWANTLHIVGIEKDYRLASSNRNKSGINILSNSILEQLVPITHEFIIKGNLSSVVCDPKYSKIIKLSDIIINKNIGYSGDIYPKRVKSMGTPLNTFCKINEWKVSDFATLPTKYLEIGDLNSQTPSKAKTSTRFCKSGDILVSSLPGRDKIVVAKNDFMLSSAIYVLSSFKSDKERDAVYCKLRTQPVLDQINALLDGFKITYAKISEYNLYNNILI